MQTSFRKYQWRESLLLSLAKLTKGLTLKSTKVIQEEMKELTEGMGQTEGLHITARQLLTIMSDRNIVPMAVKPHSIFFLCSEQNFVSACFDWLLDSVTEARETRVSMSFSLSSPGSCR